ncbi:Polypyrimidine tract-binding protein homolog 1 [Zea mays]|uniref:Polypyrimidine tract-binding protein homolog 1 n=1 Tax=Zea mays TaxID=4577 RepID=A0A1D6KP36_MAIZE|nr:Polypyrimidine tract-binding protein homolog 1 [Zea mays]
MRITFSAHKDLNIKFQSHRSRDYTNPYLPVNQTAIEGIVQPTVGPDGKVKEPESNVLLAFQASQQMTQYSMPPGAPPHAPPAGQSIYYPK